MSKMRRRLAIGGAAAGLAALTAACAMQGYGPGPGGGRGQDVQATNGNGRSCFYARNVSSWAPVDRSIVNLRVNVNDYYQLKLLGECPNIDWSERIGLEHRGSDWICSGLDAMLIAPGPAGPHRCAVSSIRKLSPQEVAALPPRQKP
jgi:hypothetical protein